VAVNLGTGTTNTFTFQQQPAPGAGVLDSLFAVSVEGGTGRDSVFVDVNGGFFQGSTAEFAADLGAGNDTFEATVDLASLLLVALPGNLRGSLHFDVEGGAGTNALAVTRNGTATTGGFTLFNRALLDVRLKGGPGADAILVDLAGALLFGGSDQGTVRVRLDGGAGNDRLALLGNVDATTAFVPVHDVVVTGGPGKDVVDVDWENDPDFSDDPTSYGPHGRIVIDGMTGGDTCTLAGANRATMRGCEQ
jgi:hypothetical protein